MALGSIADILFQWENIGFFDLILPFLLVFAIVFGILSYMNIFGSNRAVHVIIALILGLLSIRAQFFSAFLAEIAPRLGVGLTILLAILILIGLFTPEEHSKTISWVLMGIAAVILIVILSQLYNVFGYFTGGLGFTSSELIGWITMIVLLVAILIIVVVASQKGKSKLGKTGPLWAPVRGT
ncbi:MAG: hypothetical protein KJ718_03360 [Nanoarchaeota archaeon]|nr:hypothetical protein [Nanoarchaeota archaeon]MBU1051567.1 hypothetical protein [Nanoarchaeota archaeon]